MKTIVMPHSLWLQWDQKLREPDLKRANCALSKPHGKHCCLGWLQIVAEGKTEPGRALPSMDWLLEHQITFYDVDGFPAPVPYLPKLQISASRANDSGLAFPLIADAIKHHVTFC